MEIEFALPNELKTVEQYRQIIDAFIAKHLSNHYYTYAIHDKIGTLSDWQRHPHVHIMFSERIIDDVEKIKERPASAFFKYPLRKNISSEPTFEERRKHGAPKNRNWADKSFLPTLRADFAQIQNDVLEKNGYTVRVDHRSLKAQKEEAERKGDFFLARLFNRIPEPYIGIISSLDEDNPNLQRLLHFRALRKQQFDIIMRLDALSKQKEELDSKDAVNASSTKAHSFIHSTDFQSLKSPELQELKTNLFAAVNDVNKWKRIIVTYHDAQLLAKSEYMTEAERNIFLQYLELLSRKKNLKEFIKTLKQPTETQANALKAYNEIVSGVNFKISALDSSASLLKKSVDDIEAKLASPNFDHNIRLVIHQILQENIYARKKLQKANEELDKIVEQLRDAFLLQATTNENQALFNTREIYDIIRQQYLSTKKEYEKSLNLKFDLQKKTISPQRAISMAHNIFVHGDFKNLRAKVRQLKKSEQRFFAKLLAFQNREKIFLGRVWAGDEHPLFLQQKYMLTKEKTLLELEKSRIDNLKITLESKQKELSDFCLKPQSQEKIQVIASGILRKNFKYVRQLEEVENRFAILSQKLKHLKKQMGAIKLRLERDKPHIFYKVISDSNLSYSDKASIIADAFLHEPTAVQLVARFSDNNLEMEKSWELLSELDKDEIEQKKLWRDL